MTLSFEKWEGLGNDFVLIESPPKDADWVRRVCDRRLGIGADGVLFIEGARSNETRMTVLNADGSRPEMCGNGIRCVAGYVTAIGLSSNDHLAIATDAGSKVCTVTRREPGHVEVLVEMGIAKVLGEKTFDVGGRSRRFTLADVGNPHAITFERYSPEEIDTIGPVLSAFPPLGQNVEFSNLTPNGSIEVVVWERGVGRTLACGTGACAAAAVACAEGRAKYGEAIKVTLPGGDLAITIDRESGRTTMRGPARRAFRGVIDP
jgi:diaminopimelate epimerase